MIFDLRFLISDFPKLDGVKTYMDALTTIYVRVFSEEYWFGAWAPIAAKAKDEVPGVFVIAENNLTEDDEYEFYRPGMEVRVERFRDERGEAFWGVTEELLQSMESGDGL